jgi:hypothetical protein
MIQNFFQPQVHHNASLLDYLTLSMLDNFLPLDHWHFYLLPCRIRVELSSTTSFMGIIFALALAHNSATC